MGIVNVTPDSFSDGGKYSTTTLAVEHALALVEQGADILDVGGESTRPNAQPVTLEEELHRVIPVIEALSTQVNIPISIDTYKPQVMKAALAAGASLINDVRALQEPDALQVAAESSAGICLMHMLGSPQTMQDDPRYEDVVQEVSDFLKLRAEAAMEAGVAFDRILLDPGFGFGKRSVHNLALLRAIPTFLQLGFPVLAGLSRKSVLGKIVGDSSKDKLPASIAAAVIAAVNGARILRVHDVSETVAAMKVVTAVID